MIRLLFLPSEPRRSLVLPEASLLWLGGLGPRQGVGVSGWLRVDPQKPLSGLSVVTGGRAEAGTLSGLWVCDRGGSRLEPASPWLPLRELPQLRVQACGSGQQRGTPGATRIKHVTAGFSTEWLWAAE